MRTDVLNARVLLVSDDPETCQLWAFGLKQRGLESIMAGSAEVAMDYWAEKSFSLVIINVYANQADGIKLCRQLRSEIVNPILVFLSSRDESQALAAYEAGADECIFKPIGLRLFLAKVAAWSRRSWTVPTQALTSLQASDLQLDAVRRQVVTAAKVVELTNLEFRLLHFLMNHQDQVIETTTIIDRVWGYNSHADGTSLKNVVYRLRRKIEPDPHQPRYILTIMGEGYTFQSE